MTVRGCIGRSSPRRSTRKTLKVMLVYRVRHTGQVLIISDAEWKKDREFDRDVVGTASVAWKTRPAAGKHFRHYKGGTYRVVTAALHQKTGAPYVIYKSDETRAVWARPMENWWEVVEQNGKKVPRFASIP
jgi:hypothetical protein